ncbi:glucose-6-phosphate isomerase [Thioalkalivibrio sp. HK1]|uniref:glucose-6-phosphate isomerase n=1 Tax=Thioalkalivibrio sp. HK1 TaxID=1469245 RepID=UPI0004AE224B|nr:glucose-6-phosphate isomerase [Thioalkalivibrio sp. HK1]
MTLSGADAFDVSRLGMRSLLDSEIWRALGEHHALVRSLDLRTLFANESDRFDRHSLEACGILLDYSKNRVTCETMGLLFALADERGVPEQARAMFQGSAINRSEGQAALHPLLRDSREDPLCEVDVSMRACVEGSLQAMEDFSQAVRSGAWRGYRGDPIEDIVHIGIGGSELGPKMVCRALAPLADGPRVHFVSNIDGWALLSTLGHLSPARTVFVVASKTFTTQETMVNAHSARRWIEDSLGSEAVARHFVAITGARRKALEFGVDPQGIFDIPEWVGGRFSLWSSVGLPVALAVGMPVFRKLLAGAHAMDRHFLSAPGDRNMPIILALIGIWYIHFFGSQTHAVVAYDERLDRFAAHLQQLDMESNGKRVRQDGTRVEHPTGPIVWGEPGTGGQHAFFQLLHQGTPLVPVDFIVAAACDHSLFEHHRLLIANCLAQSQALMTGRCEKELRADLLSSGADLDRTEALVPHRVTEGNRPSNTLMLERLDPFTLGALIALYEHKVFVQGAIWGVNSFDQWGVELGKKVAGSVANELHLDVSSEKAKAIFQDRDRADADRDASTAGLIRAWKERAGRARGDP